MALSAKNIIKNDHLNTSNMLFGCLTAITCFFILNSFYDRFWWPPDDGTYAYVADLLNRGFILHKDIQDVHMGYVNFTNALALRLFGDDFLSLRYPLVFTTLIQSLVIAYLLMASNKVAAFATALTLTCLSFLQFINPTANWYALFLICITIFNLQVLGTKNRYRILITGFLLTTLFCFRQPSGVFAIMGVLSYLLYEANDANPPPGQRSLARVVVAILLLTLLLYMLNKTNLSGVLLFGIWPLAILIQQLIKCKAPNERVAKILLQLSLGGSVAIAPLLIYHVSHDSIGYWLQDTIVSAVGMTELPFFDSSLYALMFHYSIGNIFSGDITAKLNSIFWIILLLAPAFLGLALLKEQVNAYDSIAPLGYIPVFYTMVSVHYQIPIYLFYSVSLTLAGLMWLLHKKYVFKFLMPAVLFFLVAIGLVFQAGQPLSRGVIGTFEGDVKNKLVSSDLPHCSIRIEPSMAKKYGKILAIINETSQKNDTLLTIPFNPELNFMSKRISPFRFYNTALGMSSESDVIAAINKLQEKKTKLVIFDVNNKYNVKLTEKLVTYVKSNYRLYEKVEGFEIYMLELPKT